MQRERGRDGRKRERGEVEVYCVSVLSQLSSGGVKGQAHCAFSHSHLASLTELSGATLTGSASTAGPVNG